MVIMVGEKAPSGGGNLPTHTFVLVTDSRLVKNTVKILWPRATRTYILSVSSALYDKEKIGFEGLFSSRG